MARLRFVGAARVSLLTTTRMNGTMATDGLRDERMQLCHGWRRQIQHSFWIVSCLLVVFFVLFFAGFVNVHCIVRPSFVAVLLYGTAWRVSSRHGAARPRFVDAARVWRLATTRMNDTMTTHGLRDDRIQCCHGWWRQIQHRFCKVSCLVFFCDSFLLAPSMCAVFCVLPFLRCYVTARHGASCHGAAAAC